MGFIEDINKKLFPKSESDSTREKGVKEITDALKDEFKDIPAVRVADHGISIKKSVSKEDVTEIISRLKKFTKKRLGTLPAEAEHLIDMIKKEIESKIDTKEESEEKIIKTIPLTEEQKKRHAAHDEKIKKIQAKMNAELKKVNAFAGDLMDIKNEHWDVVEKEIAFDGSIRYNPDDQTYSLIDHTEDENIEVQARLKREELVDITSDAFMLVTMKLSLDHREHSED